MHMAFLIDRVCALMRCDINKHPLSIPLTTSGHDSVNFLVGTTQKRLHGVRYKHLACEHGILTRMCPLTRFPLGEPISNICLNC